MPLILPGNVGSATAGGFNVANSCRFDGSSAYMHKTPGSAGNTKLWTWSAWIKKSLPDGADLGIFGQYIDANNFFRIRYRSDQRLQVDNYTSGSATFSVILGSNNEHRDISAWYNLVVAYDSAQGTDSNRVKIYVNGVLQTVFQAATYPSQNVVTTLPVDGTPIELGRTTDSQFFNGYFAEVVLIDGTALAPTSFGEFDSNSNIWKPIDVSGLTFGTNGFYLDFEASGNLGNDANGGTDLTEVNLAATDQTTDTCTNNFATLNPLMNNLNNLPTLSEGNLEVLAVSGSTWSVTPSTIGLPKKGKWVFEVEAVSGTGGDRAAFAGWINPTVSNPLANGSILWRNIASTNSILSNDSAATGSFSATTWGTNGDIIGMYIDMDNSKMYFTHNGTVQNSGTGIDFQGTFDDDTFILPVVMVINTDKLSVNFGNPATNFAIASGNTDPNGFGNFEFTTTITGDGSSKSFYAICSKNIAELG